MIKSNFNKLLVKKINLFLMAKALVTHSSPFFFSTLKKKKTLMDKPRALGGSGCIKNWIWAGHPLVDLVKGCRLPVAGAHVEEYQSSCQLDWQSDLFHWTNSVKWVPSKTLSWAFPNLLALDPNHPFEFLNVTEMILTCVNSQLRPPPCLSFFILSTLDPPSSCFQSG